MDVGYRIEYGKDRSVTYFDKKEKRYRGIMTVCFFMLFCALTSVLRPAQWKQAKDYLIPGDAEITAAAFSEMTYQLQNGESLEDAVVTFCRDVISGG
jgi:hypothetical protein